MTYRMTHKQLLAHIRYLLDAENAQSKGALTVGDAVKHGYAANLLLHLAERAEAKRIKTPQIV